MTFSSLPLSYCTNVHPGRTVQEVVAGLTQYTAQVRRDFDHPLAAGLWMARSAVTELLEDPQSLELLAQTLWQHDLCCYTLNAFPYGDFHSERVKENVYLPDWTSNDRVRYTRDCATILAQLLPEGAEGSISTVPLGGEMNPSGPEFHATCFHHLIQMARFLKDLHTQTGRRIRLAVEPEPMCHMSSIPNQVVPQFQALFALADALNCEADVREYIGLCFDVCHQAVEFELIPKSFDQLADAGIRLNKIHITNAIELLSPRENSAGREALSGFVEPRYLHQTFARFSDGRIVRKLDLNQEILSATDDEFMQADAWRVHFHVPVYATELGPLRTTRPDLEAALKRLARLDYAPHLEVETYTWPVMPGTGNSQPDQLASRICQELQSATDLIADSV
ncbi:MAG: metabolite traffic protein EboE [Planctomycetaceae bacterium]